MVAITVILAAVIGTFVLGLGDSLGDSQPTAQINTEIVENSGSLDLVVEHNGGDSIDTGALTVQVTEVGGSTIEDNGLFAERFSVGDTNSTSIATSGGSTVDIRVQIIHEPSESVLVDKTTEVNNFDALAADLSF